MSNLLLAKTYEHIPLGGFVSCRSIARLVGRIRHKARRHPLRTFLLDCRAVCDFSGYALASLARLRQELQWQGCDLALTHCSDYAKSRLAVPRFESLAQQVPCPQESH